MDIIKVANKTALWVYTPILVPRVLDIKKAEYDRGIEPKSPTLQADSLLTEPPEEERFP